MFGLGHETPAAKAWINGGSPTKGFLSGAVGPFGGFYQSFAGATWANWGFMLGLICIAVALLLGVGMRIACVGGAVLTVLMWSASLPPSDDVFMDNHIVYALVPSSWPWWALATLLDWVTGGPRRALSVASDGSPESHWRWRSGRS